MQWKLILFRQYSLLGWSKYLQALSHPDFNKFVTGSIDVDMIVDGFVSPQNVYVKKREWQQLVLSPFADILFDHKKFHRYLHAYRVSGVRLLHFAKRLQKTRWENLPDEKLEFLLKLSKDYFISFGGVAIWGVWILHEFFSIPQVVDHYLGNFIEGDDKALLFVPYKLSVHFKEEKSLSKLNFNDNRAVKKHLQRFGWLPCVDWVDDPWQSKDLRKRKKHLNKQRLTLSILERRRQLQKCWRVLNNLPANLKKKANLIRELVYIKDSRNDIRFYAISVLRNLYNQVALRRKMSLTGIVHLLDEEVLDLLRQPTKTSYYQKMIRDRSKGYILIKKGKNIKVKIKKNKSITRITALFDKDKEGLIKGIPAFIGKVRGKAKLVRNNNDLRKIKRGDIMVAVFTRPHYLSAMKIAKAIITDEGGITSHAAIVAREFKIPCIVGTKVATKVLQDGDLVEVDAKKGEIRKIK